MRIHRLLVWVFICSFASFHLWAKPSTLDLAGRWDGLVMFGKFKFKMNLKIAPADGKVKVTLDIPDQGVKDLPVTALLYNHPDVRVEIDQFGTAFNGTLASDGGSIKGEFEEGPGGRPIEVTFKKNLEGDKPEPTKAYTFKAGEQKDVRGYWKSSFEAMKDMRITVGLKIGLLSDGTYNALMDVFQQGAADIPATVCTITNGTVKLEWELFRLTFNGKLSANGDELVGTWKQGPKGVDVTFARLNQPATAFAEDVSWTPDKTQAQDPRGEWKGVLNANGNNLRLVFKIGKQKDASYTGSLISLDQGGRELLVSSIGYTNPVVRIECKMIGGTYIGNLNKDGTALEGNWEQFGGGPMPLKLDRVETKSAEAKK